MSRGRRRGQDRAGNDRHIPPLKLPSMYQAMWLFAMFDLPVGTREERRAATRFRKDLLREGFSMLQFSVYGRYCVSEEVSHAICKRVEAFVPEDGQVRLLMVTEKQFSKQRIYTRGKRAPGESAPHQFQMF